MWNLSSIRSKAGRDPGVAGEAAIQGLIRALNNQMGTFRLTGHMPDTQAYNNNLGYDLTDSGIVPRGQGAPFPAQPRRNPWGSR